jgi:hypothetical protein
MSLSTAPTVSSPTAAPVSSGGSPVSSGESLERRKQRSADPLVALHYQLAQSKSHSAAEAIVLADTAGVVVAGAGSWIVCEELAAYAPLFSRDGNADFGLPARVASLRAECEVREMTAGGQPMLLCAMGKSAARSRAADLASAGVVRILETPV